MNEAETRADYIDPALKAAGWGVVDGSRIRREYPITLGRIEGHGKRGKELTADYLLEYRNTKLGIVEAKAWDIPKHKSSFVSYTWYATHSSTFPGKTTRQ